jgi:hypothetical protein
VHSGMLPFVYNVVVYLLAQLRFNCTTLYAHHKSACQTESVNGLMQITCINVSS